jgi:hypothetical protein
MTAALVVVLSCVWTTTLVFGAAGFGYNGSAAPSVGPGLGAAIAVLIAIAGALGSAILLIVLAVHFDTRWPIVACIASLPLPLPWLVARLRRRG